MTDIAPVVVPSTAPTVAPRALRQALRRLPVPALAIVGTTLLVALFADMLVPHDPLAIDPANGRRPPAFLEGGDWAFALGTDQLGRDVLSRVIKGTQTSMAVVVVTIVVAGGVGTVLGMIAGYFRGWVDTVVMRTVDAALAFPAILIAMVFVVTVGPGFWVVVGVLSLLLWSRFARLVRGEVLSWRERDFIALARVAGCSTLRILVVHIFPNILSSVVVLATLQIGWVIAIETTLSFLGAGIPPPTPTWGGLVADGRDVLRSLWWISLTPGMAIVAVVLSFNVLGDWLRRALDPQLRQL